MENVPSVQITAQPVHGGDDPLSLLLGRQAFNARIFFNGSFCDANQFSENGHSGHLHLIRAGPVEFVHGDGSVLRVEQPGLVFYPRGLAHRLQVPAGNMASLLCATIVFADGLRNPLARVLPNCLHLRLADIGGLGATIGLLADEAGGSGPGRELILDRLCDVLLVQVVRREFEIGTLSPELLSGLTDRQLAPALAAIHERPAEPWTLQALAGEAHMSRAAFTERFRVTMGIPPGEYLTRWRMALAGRLLRAGLPVKLVSSRTGYTSASTFTRAFSALMGASPREWLRQEL